MASSVPGLLTIPREIRDLIWELHYIKNNEQDPFPWTRPNRYPYMKSAIYLTNRQLNEEHKDNLSRKDMWIDISISRNFDFYEPKSDRKMILRDLNYPFLRSYVLKINIDESVLITDILNRMAVVIGHMRKQKVHRNNMLALDVAFTNDYFSRFFQGYSHRIDQYILSNECEWCFYLKVDVFQLKVVEYRNRLTELPHSDKDVSPALEILRYAERALDSLRDTMEDDGTDRVARVSTKGYTRNIMRS